MAIARPSLKLRGAFARGAGFGIARRLFRGFSFDSITKWLVRAFGNLAEKDLLALVEHGRQMRTAGDILTSLTPGGVLSFSDIPVNPWLSQGITEGARTVSELIVPWQIQGTAQEGEWYHRFRFPDVIAVDEVTDMIDTWIVGNVADSGSPPLGEITSSQINIGAFVGIGIERTF